MAGANQATIESAYAALTTTSDIESEVRSGSNFYVVVKAEAGRAIVNLGAKYKLRVLLQDITNFQNVLNKVVTGNLSDAAWPKADEDTIFSFPVTAGATDTIYKVIAVLSIGVKETGTQSFESGPILVTE